MGDAMPGIVYLVGAGPGDPGLLTLKGRDCLAAADIVIYDYLANAALLDFAPAAAERIYAGKQANRHTLSQDEINDLLVEKAREGKTVVRLKGGDPFLFGRGSEEAAALRDAGIPYVVVPGVTSAIAVPAYAGIPITHRGLASTVTIATGHEDPAKPESALNWGALAASDTLVLLMGVGNLPEIVANLRSGGRAAETPIALIRWGTKSEQETIVATLDTIESVLHDRPTPFLPPAIIVVGEVVRLRDQLRWFDNDPLFGRRVLVTRSRERASELSDRLIASGAIPIELPALSVEALHAPDLDATLRQLDRYDWICFSSAVGVSLTVARLAVLGVPKAILAARQVAVIGPATERAATTAGLPVAYRPEQFVAEALADGLPVRRGECVLLALAEGARPVLKERLRQRGAAVDQVAVYRTAPGERDVAALQEALAPGIHAATFASSSTVQNFSDLAVQSGHNGPAQALQGAVVACIGPVTAATAREVGLAVDVVATEHSVPGLVDALRAHFATVQGAS